MLTIEHLAELLDRHREALGARVHSFELAGRRFAGGPEPDLMGVINLSPDSWYRESVCLSVEQAVRRGLRLRAEGAAIVDVGAESTVPEAAAVNPARQCAALVPVVRDLAAENIVVSAETYHCEVAKACLDAGARVLNLTAGAGSDEMFRLVAAREAAVILCFVQGKNVRSVGDLDCGPDPTAAMREYFARQIEAAERAGVRRIWIDPGLGFYYRNLRDSARRVRHQMRTFLETFRLRTLGWPVCHALPHAFEFFEDEVRCAEAFFAVMALLGRADLLRTHEVAKVRAVVRTMACFGEVADGR